MDQKPSEKICITIDCQSPSRLITNDEQQRDQHDGHTVKLLTELNTLTLQRSVKLAKIYEVVTSTFEKAIEELKVILTNWKNEYVKAMDDLTQFAEAAINPDISVLDQVKVTMFTQLPNVVKELRIIPSLKHYTNIRLHEIVGQFQKTLIQKCKDYEATYKEESLKEEDDDDQLVRGTQRPDGSWRPDIKIKPGYQNSEMVKKYVIPQKRSEKK